MSTNVVGYIRVSTDGQCGEDRYGMDVQKAKIEEYCAKNDMEIVRWFKDEGESGAKMRPGFDEIIYGEITNPPYECVVVAKSDRVARDINVYYYYKMMLRNKNIKLISIAEDFGQFGVFASMLEAFTLCVAEMERENIVKRTSAGRNAKAARGGYSGGKPPYGYKPVDGMLVIEPHEAELVREVYRMKESGSTYIEICNELERLGYVGRTGSRIAISTLQGILKNKKLYQGYYRYGRTDEWIKGQQAAILPDDGDGDGDGDSGAGSWDGASVDTE